MSYNWTEFEISLTNQINFIVLKFYHILGKMTVNLTYTLNLASRPKSRRICPGVRLRTTLIIRHIVTYFWKEFEKSLTYQINLIVLMFYHILCKVTVNLTCNSILHSRPRIRRICPGVRLQTTLMVRHIVTYIWTQFEISLTLQINLIILIFIIIY